MLCLSTVVSSLSAIKDRLLCKQSTAMQFIAHVIKLFILAKFILYNCITPNEHQLSAMVASQGVLVTVVMVDLLQ